MSFCLLFSFGKGIGIHAMNQVQNMPIALIRSLLESIIPSIQKMDFQILIITYSIMRGENELIYNLKGIEKCRSFLSYYALDAKKYLLHKFIHVSQQQRSSIF